MRVPDTLHAPTPSATLVRRVVADLETRLQSQSLKPGDRLPSERALGQLLGVSRTVVRGAAAELSARGLLAALPGGGYEIRTPTAGQVSASLTFMLRDSARTMDYRHVHQVRRLLEVEIAGLAAQNRRAADLDAARAAIDALADDDATAEARCLADVEFHRVLAVATGNPLFPVLLDAIADTLTDVRRSGHRLPEGVPSGLFHHNAILDAVAAGDVAAARAAMEAHLTDSEAIQRRVAEAVP